MPVGTLEDYKSILQGPDCIIEFNGNYHGSIVAHGLWSVLSILLPRIRDQKKQDEFEVAFTALVRATGFADVIGSGKNSDGISAPDTYTEEQFNAFAKALYETDREFNGMLIDALEAQGKYKRTPPQAANRRGI